MKESGSSLIIFLFFILLFEMNNIHVFSQKEKTRKIQFEANVVEMNKKISADAKRLIGEVVFTHKGAVMYCDSAYYYSDSNSLDAFSNVYINQGDTINLYSDYANYNGNTRMAEARENVKLIDRDKDGETILYTDYLDYDMNSNTGFYTDSGKVVSGDNELYSIKGYYYADQEVYFFKDSVEIYTPDYTIYSDTLKYNTHTGVSYFYGPTDIISDDNYIYCENGWYDTEKDISQFSENAYLLKNDQRLKGDSMYYNRNLAYGEAFQNVEIFDSARNIIIKGHYAIMYEKTEESLVTDSAVFIDVSESDTLYMHGDTLRSLPDTLRPLPDSLMSDTSVIPYKRIKAYYKVKIFRSNMQGKCDSLTYTTLDSVFKMYVNPVLWSDQHQITADFMKMYTGNGRIDSFQTYDNSFIVSQVDTSKYNQIKGKDMVGYFKDNELNKIDVYGNGQTIYYPIDEDDEIVGVNKASSSNITINLLDQEIDRIYFLNKPEAVFMPVEEVNPRDLILSGFMWLEHLRPKSKNDIFIWNEE